MLNFGEGFFFSLNNLLVNVPQYFPINFLFLNKFFLTHFQINYLAFIIIMIICWILKIAFRNLIIERIINQTVMKIVFGSYFQYYWQPELSIHSFFWFCLKSIFFSAFFHLKFALMNFHNVQFYFQKSFASCNHNVNFTFIFENLI